MEYIWYYSFSCFISCEHDRLLVIIITYYFNLFYYNFNILATALIINDNPGSELGVIGFVKILLLRAV